MTKRISSADPVEQFIRRVERFRRKHCDPDNPRGWLAGADWRRAYRKAASGYSAAYCALIPRLGKTETDAITGALLHILREHENCMSRLRGEDRRHYADKLQWLRNTYHDADLQAIYAILREAVTSSRKSAPTRKQGNSKVGHPRKVLTERDKWILKHWPEAREAKKTKAQFAKRVPRRYGRTTVDDVKAILNLNAVRQHRADSAVESA
jgi:hypothetical protein